MHAQLGSFPKVVEAKKSRMAAIITSHINAIKLDNQS
jgi:hypothetical protein